MRHIIYRAIAGFGLVLISAMAEGSASPKETETPAEEDSAAGGAPYPIEFAPSDYAYPTEIMERMRAAIVELQGVPLDEGVQDEAGH